MPVPNDLTPEEQAEFTGGAPAPAPAPSPAPAEEAAPAPAPSPAPAEEAAPAEPQPGELGSKHRADGTFKSKDELEADKKLMEAIAARAPAPEAAPAPAPAAEQQSTMVPHQALHEARQQAAQLRQQLQMATARMNQIISARTQTPSNEPLPDLATNPAAYIEALGRKLEALEQNRQQEDQYSHVDNGLQQDEMIFASMTPDYDAASAHYLRSRMAELGTFYPPQQVQTMLMQEAREIAQQSWNRGLSAAETIYNLAKARGYTPGQSGAPAQAIPGLEQALGGAPASAPNPTPTTPAPPPANGPTPAAVVAAAQNGQQQSRSLSAAPGTAPGASLNAEAILSMSDEEFEQALGLGQKGANSRFQSIFS